MIYRRRSEEGQVPLMTPQLWQEMKMQGTTLEDWRHSPETWNELFKHWTIAASAGEYQLCGSY